MLSRSDREQASSNDEKPFCIESKKRFCLKNKKRGTRKHHSALTELLVSFGVPCKSLKVSGLGVYKQRSKGVERTLQIFDSVSTLN